MTLKKIGSIFLFAKSRAKRRRKREVTRENAALPGRMLRKRPRDDSEQCDELQAEQGEANAADAASEVVGEGSSEEDGERSSEGGSETSLDTEFLGVCEYSILCRQFDDVLEGNKRYTAHLNREDYTAFRNAGMELLGPFYSVLMAECIGSPPAFLLAIKTAAQTAAVKEIQKTALSQPRLTLLKEAVSLAVYNYACLMRPEKHPITGQKMSAALVATEDFEPGCNSLV